MYLYKMIKKRKLKELDTKGYITFDSITSFTDEVSSRHSEFGNVLLKVKKTPICKRYSCTKIQYTLNWFKKHPKVYKWMTWNTLQSAINFINQHITEYGHYSNEKSLTKAFEKMLYNKDYMRESEIIVESKNSKPVKIYDKEIVKQREYSNDFIQGGLTW